MLCDELQDLLTASNKGEGYKHGITGTDHMAPFVTSVHALCSQRKEYDQTRLGTDLELAMRRNMVLLLQQPESIEEVRSLGQASAMSRLLRFSTQLAEAVGSSAADTPLASCLLALRKVPFLLLEDIFDCQSADTTAMLWSALLMPLKHTLVARNLFSVGKNLLLRLCNSLLRRLSRSCHTALVGSVKLFLAAAFPINDPSAVNLGRKHNLSNVVQYEGEEAYIAVVGSHAQEAGSDNGNGENKGRGEGHKAEELVRGDQAVEGNEHEEAGEVGEEGEEGEEEEEEDKESKGDVSAADATRGPLWRFRLDRADFADRPRDAASAVQQLSYADYAKVWGLQSLMAAEQRGLVDPLPLMQRCREVLSLLEANTLTQVDAEAEGRRRRAAIATAVASSPPSSSAEGASHGKDKKETTVGRAKGKAASANTPAAAAAAAAASAAAASALAESAQTGAKEEGASEYLGVRYLTAPELLPLQLQSHPFHQQLAVQMLLACQSVRAHQRSQALGSTHVPETQATPVTPTTTAAAAVPDPRNAKAFEIWVAGQLRSIEDRCFAIVSDSPQGQRIADLLRRVLWRELKWGAWKEAQCPPLSREPLAVSAATVLSSDNQAASAGLSTVRALAFGFPKDLSEVRNKLQDLADSVPSYASHIEDFVDAEDPANGIEDEYHPRHDGVYCWRALRLLAERHLATFAEMRDGDLRIGLKAASAASEGRVTGKQGPWIVLTERELPAPAAVAAVDEAVGSADPVDNGVDVAADTSEAYTNTAEKTEYDAKQDMDEDANADANGAVAADPVIETPAVCLQIEQYANVETAESIRAYVEKFAPVLDVQLIKANKAKGTSKVALVSCEDGDGVRTLLESSRRHMLNNASLLISIYIDSPTSNHAADKGKKKGKKHEENESVPTAASRSLDEEELDAKQPPTKKRRK